MRSLCVSAAVVLSVAGSTAAAQTPSPGSPTASPQVTAPPRQAQPSNGPPPTTSATLGPISATGDTVAYVSAESTGHPAVFIGSDVSPYGIVGTYSNHSLGFRTNNIARMFIDTNGNVGIGTSAPATGLDMAGAASLRGMATPGLAPAGQGRIYFDSGLNKFRVSQNGGAYADLVGGASLALPFAATASSASTLFDLTQIGTGSIANFTISNASNGSTGVRIERNGTGIAFQARNIGSSGEAAIIQIDNATNPSTALIVGVNGTGNGANISGGSGGKGLIVSGSPRALDINGSYRMTGANFASGDVLPDNYGQNIVEVICNNPVASCASDATAATITLPANPELGSIIWITTIDPNGVTVLGNIKGVASVSVSANVVRGFIFWGGSGTIFGPPQWRPFF